MCGFLCHGVEVTHWSRYVLENLIGCPFVGKLPASFGTQRFGTIFIHKPNECTSKERERERERERSYIALLLLITMFALSCH